MRVRLPLPTLMNPEVFPFSGEHPRSAQLLLEVAGPILGCSLTRFIDEHHLKIEGPKASICILHEIMGSKYLQSPLLLQHSYLGFLILAERSVNIELLRSYSSVVSISVDSRFDLCYLSGSILALRLAVTTPTTNVGVRGVMNRIYEHICEIGMEAVFAKWSKTDLGDGTFKLLEYK